MIHSISDKFALRFVESARLRKRLAIVLLILFACTVLAVASNPLKRGLIGQYYDNAEWDGSPLMTTRDRSFNLLRMKSEYPTKYENYSIQWTGTIYIPVAGEYQFTTISDDGSELHIQDQLIVDNRGLHGFQERSGSIELKKGFYPITIRYMQGGIAANFEVYWTPPGKDREALSRASLFREKPTPVAFFIGRLLRILLVICVFLWVVSFIGVTLIGFSGRCILLPFLKTSFIGKAYVKCRSWIVKESVEKRAFPDALLFPIKGERDTSPGLLLRRVRGGVLALVGYTILTLVWTYPIIVNFSTKMAGKGGDRYLYLWNMWWMKKALFDLHTNPLYTNYLFYPKGVTLAFHDFTLLNTLFSLPLQQFLSLSEIYNLLFLLTFILGGFGCFLLVRYLTGDSLAAFLSGLIFAFWGGRVHYISHLSLASIQWFPYCALYLIKTLREKSYRNPVLAAIFLAMNALSAWYYAIYMSLFVTLFFLYSAWTERKTFFTVSCLKRVGLIGIIFIGIMSPVLYPMMTEIFGGEDYMVSPVFVLDSASPNALLLPHINHLFLGKYMRYFYLKYGLPLQWGLAGGSFIGYTVILLCLYTIFKLRHLKQRFWLIAFLFFLVLSLGPHPVIFSKVYSSIPLPYQLLQHIPILKILRIPIRFMVIVMFCCSVLAGYACWDIFRRIRIRKTVFSILALFILFECARLYYAKPPEKTPDFYKELGKDSENYAILELTRLMKWEHSSVRSSLFQITHEKKLFHGHVSRIPFEVYYQAYAIYSVFNDLATHPREYLDQAMGQNLSLSNDKKSIATLLSFYNVRYIALYHDYPYGDLGETLRRLKKLFGEPIANQHGIYLFKVDEIPVSESLVFPGLGMFPLQFDSDGNSVRQAAREADIKVLNVDQCQKVQIRFQGKGYTLPEEQVEISVNGTLVTTAAVGDWTEVVTPAVAIKPGENTIKLCTLENGDEKYGIRMRNIEVKLTMNNEE